jgi:hypothetical protein
MFYFLLTLLRSRQSFLIRVLRWKASTPTEGARRNETSAEAVWKKKKKRKTKTQKEIIFEVYTHSNKRRKTSRINMKFSFEKNSRLDIDVF